MERFHRGKTGSATQCPCFWPNLFQFWEFGVVEGLGGCPESRGVDGLVCNFPGVALKLPFRMWSQSSTFLGV